MKISKMLLFIMVLCASTLSISKENPKKSLHDFKKESKSPLDSKEKIIKKMEDAKRQHANDSKEKKEMPDNSIDRIIIKNHEVGDPCKLNESLPVCYKGG